MKKSLLTTPSQAQLLSESPYYNKIHLIIDFIRKHKCDWPYFLRIITCSLLIPFFVTHFLQTLFNQAQFHCELNSCITFYFILLSIAQAHVTYGEIEEVWFGGYGSVSFGPFA